MFAAYRRGWTMQRIADAFAFNVADVHFFLHTHGAEIRRTGRASKMHDPAARRKVARMLYAGEARKTIAHELGVDVRTLAGWIKQGRHLQ